MTLIKLIEQLEKLSKDKSIGELIFSNQDVFCQLYLVNGSLLYVADNFHPVRRWRRGLQRHCPNFFIEPEQLLHNESWEIQILEQGINEKQLSLMEAKLIIRSVAQECLFELSTYKDLKSKWQPSQKKVSPMAMRLALSSFEMQAIIGRVKNMDREWQAAGLSNLSPSFVPKLKEDSYHQVVPVLDKYLNGKFTLWDIALELKKSVYEVAYSLRPLIQKGMLKFQKIPDLRGPIVTQKKPISPKKKPTKSHQKQPLIACIDDSPIWGHTLSKILMTARYEILSIEEPMGGFGKLMEHKPDLILLDLNMPHVNGYSVCKFLREIDLFENTPIIILTAQSSTIESVRAKMAGATDFLAKPPRPLELLQMIKKYLAQSNNPTT